MPIYRESGEPLLYEVIKVQTCSGQPLESTQAYFVSEANTKVINGLGAGETWNASGLGDEIVMYGTATVCVFSNQPSATSGLVFEASLDRSNWEEMEAYTYQSAERLESFSMAPAGRYFRVRFTNGATPSTFTRIQTVYRQCYTKPSSHRIGDNISAEKDAELVKAVLAAEKPDGIFTDINATQGGNLKVSVEETEGSLPVYVLPSTPTTTSVPASITSVTLASNNANRRGLSIQNLSSANLLISFTSPATSGNCFRRLAANEYVQFDQQLVFSGDVYGIWDAATGTAQVTNYV